MSERRRGGRIATVLLLLLLAGVAAAAIVDSVGKSVSGDDRGQARAVSTAAVRAVHLPGRGELSARLLARHVNGVLYYVDRWCNLHALGLPALTPSPAMQQPQAEAKSTQQACAIVIDGEGLTGGSVGATAHTGLHASDRLRVGLIARPVLPRATIAEGADR